MKQHPPKETLLKNAAVALRKAGWTYTDTVIGWYQTLYQRPQDTSDADDKAKDAIKACMNAELDDELVTPIGE